MQSRAESFNLLCYHDTYTNSNFHAKSEHGEYKISYIYTYLPTVNL